jgi:hypothetical protein
MLKRSRGDRLQQRAYPEKQAGGFANATFRRLSNLKGDGLRCHMRIIRVLFFAALAILMSGTGWSAGRAARSAPAARVARAPAMRPARPSVNRAVGVQRERMPTPRHSHVSRDRNGDLHRHIAVGPAQTLFGSDYADNWDNSYYGSDGTTDSSVDGEVSSGLPDSALPPVDPLAQRNAARDAMDQAQARLKADREASSQWSEIGGAMAQALSDLESARMRIERSLSGRADYQAAVAEKQAAEELADQIHSAGDVSPEQMMPIALRGLNAGKLITRLQTQALTTDPQWLNARARLQATAAGREAMVNQSQTY